MTKVKPPAVVAVQLANHETGTLQNIAEISRQLAGFKICFHRDAVQAVGKVAFSFSGLGVDTLALSGHKLGGFPGAGALVVKGGRALPPLIPGEQERGNRGGTEPLVALCVLGWACELLRGRLGGWKEVAKLRDALEQSLLARGLAERIFGQNAPKYHMFGAATTTYRPGGSGRFGFERNCGILWAGLQRRGEPGEQGGYGYGFY